MLNQSRKPRLGLLYQDLTIFSNFEKFRKCRSQKDLSLGLLNSLINFNLSEVVDDIISWSRSSSKPSGRQASTAGFGIDIAS